MTDARLARLTVAAIFIYHGLVPKLLMRDATELQLLDAHGLPHGVLALAGAGELLLGLLIALLHRQRWPLYRYNDGSLWFLDESYVVSRKRD